MIRWINERNPRKEISGRIEVSDEIGYSLYLSLSLLTPQVAELMIATTSRRWLLGHRYLSKPVLSLPVNLFWSQATAETKKHVFWSQGNRENNSVQLISKT
jgi:hypothetical protein